MYPIGVLFGLGFDTATEVGLLGISRRRRAQGLSIWSILVFPALFTAGMTFIDTADSILMLGAYGWAFVKPQRKLYYNLTITAASIVVALLVGGLEDLGLVGDELGLTDGGGFWGAIGTVNDNFGALGYPRRRLRRRWLVSAAVYRFGGHDHLSPVHGCTHVHRLSHARRRGRRSDGALRAAGRSAGGFDAARRRPSRRRRTRSSISVRRCACSTRRRRV